MTARKSQKRSALNKGQGENRREREREREGQLALRTGYNCLTLKKMGCVRGGGGWTDGRAREQDRKGLEDVAEEVAVLREAGGRRGNGSSGCERRAWRDTTALHVCVARGGEKRHEEACGVARGRIGGGSEVWAALTCG